MFFPENVVDQPVAGKKERTIPQRGRLPWIVPGVAWVLGVPLPVQGD
jgi:hypothetical protein